MEGRLAQAIGQMDPGISAGDGSPGVVPVNLEDHLLYPHPESAAAGILTISGIIIVLALAIALLTGAMLVNLLDMALPTFVDALLPWVPSVALAEVYRLAMVQTVASARLWANLGVVAAVSAGLYALVIWRVRREDR